MSSAPRVAVIGAGIMGCSTALFLARGGCQVTLIDQAHAPMTGASRWNEGKIHLGYLYAGDPGGNTAGKLMPGGIAFKGLMEELLGCPIASAISVRDDIYFVHPDSVANAEQMESYFRMLDKKLSSYDETSYLGPFQKTAALSAAEVAKYAADEIRAGFQVPERSVDTRWIADRLADAVAREPGISFKGNCRIERVTPEDDGSWKLRARDGETDHFQFVVNCAWEGLLAIDRSAGLNPEGAWSHRYRLSLFVETNAEVSIPNAVVATGPFGDVKNYDNRRFYLSWYPAGLAAEGFEIEPPEIPVRAAGQVIENTKRGLVSVLPMVEAVFDAASKVEVRGGWVYAQGSGSLSSPSASLHRRDRFGIRNSGTYFSADTGKYSTAPWLARILADRLVALFRAAESP